MKKLVLLILAIVFLFGCQSNTFSLEEKYYEKSEIVDIDSEELQKLEDNKESFIVFVHLPDCFSCQDFNEVIKDLLDNENLTVYRTTFDEIENSNMSGKVLYAPSLVIYKNGKVHKFLDASSDDDLSYYENSKNLTKWLKNNINLK